MQPLKLITLSPIQSPPRRLDFVAFDTEGDGTRNGFRLAATYDSAGGRIFHRKKDLRDFLFSHRNRDKRILAANLEYDWSVAFQPFDEHHSVLLANGVWLRASYSDNSHHTFTAWDIQRIAPLSVHDMGQVIGLEKYPTPPELLDAHLHHNRHFVCEDHHRTDCVECYCMRDAEIVYKFAALYQDELNALGGQMKMTAASCSMDLFKRQYLREEIAPTYEKKNDFARRALYGGRTENFRAGTDVHVNAYDFNSLYPSVMRDLAIPRPDTLHYLSHTSRLYSRLDHWGIIEATMEIPATYLPILPARVHGHNYYTTGRIKGVWTFGEIKYALERGARVIESGALIFAEETLNPFREFVDDLYARKRLYRETHDRREVVVKLLLNSLWGKFAQRTDDSLSLLVTPPKHYKLSDFAGHEPVEIAGREAFLKYIDPRVQSPHIHVPWACEVTAQARMRLHQVLETVPDSLYYCDTDSIHTTSELATGEDLGELKLAERFERVTYLAPKEYGGLNTRGKFVGHAKGIPPDAQKEFLERGHVRFKRPQHTLEAIRVRGRIAEWKLVTKSRQQHPPVRDYPPLEDFNDYSIDSRPYDFGAIPED